MGAGCGAVAGMKGGESLPEVHAERGSDTPAPKMLTCGGDVGSSASRDRLLSKRKQALDVGASSKEWVAAACLIVPFSPLILWHTSNNEAGAVVVSTGERRQVERRHPPTPLHALAFRKRGRGPWVSQHTGNRKHKPPRHSVLSPVSQAQWMVRRKEQVTKSMEVTPDGNN